MLFSVYPLGVIAEERHGDEADVPATKLPFTYRILTLSFPLQRCRSRYNCVVIILKALFFASANDSSGARTIVSKSGM